ncbi:hypothetical protein K456DRAFT_513350 [Colletotrichum gloeosporioides 23]|nr:hypothetical protein K456DRAFT_513350 [Colletotrichum gloeosporioides 23]
MAAATCDKRHVPKAIKGSSLFLILGIILFTIHWKCAASRPCVNNRCVLLQCKEGKPERAPPGGWSMGEDGNPIHAPAPPKCCVPMGGSRDDLSRRDAPVLTSLHAAKEVDRVKVSSF